MRVRTMAAPTRTTRTRDGIRQLQAGCGDDMRASTSAEMYMAERRLDREDAAVMRRELTEAS